MLAKNVKEWMCSFSGCDGGDLNSPVIPFLGGMLG